MGIDRIGLDNLTSVSHLTTLLFNMSILKWTGLAALGLAAGVAAHGHVNFIAVNGKQLVFPVSFFPASKDVMFLFYGRCRILNSSSCVLVG